MEWNASWGASAGNSHSSLDDNMWMEVKTNSSVSPTRKLLVRRKLKTEAEFCKLNQNFSAIGSSSSINIDTQQSPLTERWMTMHEMSMQTTQSEVGLSKQQPRLEFHSHVSDGISFGLDFP